MHCKRLSIVVGAILLASTLTGCAEFYGWRSDSQTTREPRPERAKTETERAAKPLQLSGAVASDRIVVTVKAEDLCRINTITPIADVTRTKREPTTSGNAAGATLVVAALWFFTPTILASQCASGNDCGLDGSILDRWQKIGFSTLGIGLGSIAVAHGLWALAANRDSEEIKVVDKLVAAGQWKTCPGKIPADGAAAVAITHQNGNKTPVGIARFDAQGIASVAIGKAGEGFGVNGDGDVVASYEQLTAHVACGSWTACNQAHRCATLSANTPSNVKELSKNFRLWRAGEAPRDQRRATAFVDLLEQIHQTSVELAEGVPNCPLTERRHLDEQWRIVMSEMRVDSFPGLRIPALDEMARDAKTSVVWAHADDPYHHVAAAWLAKLPADLAGYKASVIQRCSQIAKDLGAKKKGDNWTQVAAVSEAVVPDCIDAPDLSALVELQRWALDSACRAEKTRERCQLACDVGAKSGCQVVAAMDEVARRARAKTDETDRLKQAAEQRQQAKVDEAEGRVQAAQLAKAERQQRAASTDYLRELTKICAVTRSTHCRNVHRGECHSENPYASAQYCASRAEHRLFDMKMVCAAMVLAAKDAAKPQMDLGTWRLLPCGF